MNGQIKKYEGVEGYEGVVPVSTLMQLHSIGPGVTDFRYKRSVRVSHDSHGTFSARVGTEVALMRGLMMLFGSGCVSPGVYCPQHSSMFQHIPTLSGSSGNK